jgi:hypothetical protein
MMHTSQRMVDTLGCKGYSFNLKMYLLKRIGLFVTYISTA